MPQTHSKWPMMLLRICALTCVITVSGGDGGIFGTGDGSDPITPIDGMSTAELSTGPTDAIDTDDTTGTSAGADAGTGDDTGSDTGADTGTAGGADGGSATAGSTEDASTSSGTTDGQVASSTENGSPPTGTTDEQAGDTGSASFNNMSDVTSAADAQMTVINLSRRAIIVALAEELDTLTNEPVLASGQASAHVSVPLGGVDLEIRSAADDMSITTLYRLSPLTLVSGSVTTLIVRDRTTGIDVVALQTDIATSAAGLARVRLIQATDFGADNVVANFLLQSATPNPSGAEASFDGLSFDAPDSVYQELPPGDYTLIDSAERFAPQPITLLDGLVYTLIMQELADPLLYIELDNEIGE